MFEGWNYLYIVLRSWVKIDDQRFVDDCGCSYQVRRVKDGPSELGANGISEDREELKISEENCHASEEAGSLWSCVVSDDG